jgi:hypothetical protein
MKKRQEEAELGDALNLAVPRYEPPPGLEERILAALPTGKRVGSSRSVFWTWGALTAAILVLAAGNVVQWLAPRPSAMAVKPGLMVVMLNGTEAASKAFGTIVLDPDDNHGILAARDLPVLTGDQHYQLWLKKGNAIQSGGVFGVNSDGYGSLLLTIPDGFRGFTDFFVSREPGADSRIPTLPPVMTGGI